MAPGGRALACDDRVADLDATVGDFWAWALGDPRTNRTRGLFAEWIVGRVLSLPPESMREEWADWDLDWDDLRVEVKTTGIVQAWEPRPGGRSPQKFTGLRGRRYDDASGQRSLLPEFKAHICVFCAQTTEDKRTYDLTDPEQWEFWVMTVDEVAQLNQGSIRLGRLNSLGVDGCKGWADLGEVLSRVRGRLSQSDSVISPSSPPRPSSRGGSAQE